MTYLQQIAHSVLHLFYPHQCLGCNSDTLPKEVLLCARCMATLPHTHFAKEVNNPVEALFTGRLTVQAAFAAFYFNKGTLVQQLIHHLKYKGHAEAGLYLGRLMAEAMQQSNRFTGIDYLVPLPLFAHKQLQRGYNQAVLLCQGMAEVTGIQVLETAIIRQRNTATQTRKHRTERWENVAGSFIVPDAAILQDKHLLLVDDVVTTGATLDAGGNVLLQVPSVKLSIAAFAYAVKS